MSVARASLPFLDCSPLAVRALSFHPRDSQKGIQARLDGNKRFYVVDIAFLEVFGSRTCLSPASIHS
jgi:hypothetical protein